MYQEFNDKELKIADQVAEEVLIREKRQRIFLWLFLLLFVVLLTFFSSLVFSRVAYFGKTHENYIQAGYVLFAYEEGSNFININGALPMEDEVGKAMNKENEYFKFSVTLTPSKKYQKQINYEISLTPKQTTLDSKYVKVYLLENDHEILINGKITELFSNLKTSKIRPDSRVLYKNTINSKVRNTYIFKMWVSSNYQIKDQTETFSCYVNVDAY